jgi:superfamily I DNA/RNA helicase
MATLPDRVRPAAAKLLAGLNTAQAVGVSAPLGQYFVSAGPGSGKTALLVRRIAWHIRVHGISPDGVLAVTFTNKAAAEMTGRLAALVGDAAARVTSGTFHSVCARFLRRFGNQPPLNMSQSFTIADSADQRSLVTRLCKEQGYPADKRSLRNILSHISNWKCSFVTPAEAARSVTSPGSLHGFAGEEERAATVYALYEAALSENACLDFDGLLIAAVRLLEENASVRARFAACWRAVLVDEWQDTSVLQYRFVRCVACAHRCLTVVGDTAQSVYGWRGADARNTLLLRDDFPGLATVRLALNYRSTAHILSVAQHILTHDSSHANNDALTALVAVRGAPSAAPDSPALDPADSPAISTSGVVAAPVVLRGLDTPDDEAQALAADIDRLVRTRHLSYGHCAVLYRVNYLSRPLEDALRARRIPFRIVGGLGFYERAEIKDLTCYMRLVANRADSFAFLRVINTPSRRFGPKTLEQVRAVAAEKKISLYEAFKQVVTLPRARQFVTIIDELAECTLQYRTHLTAHCASATTASAGPQAATAGASTHLPAAEELVPGSATYVLEQVIQRVGYEAWLRESEKDAVRLDTRLQNIAELKTVAVRFDQAFSAAVVSSIRTRRAAFERVTGGAVPQQAADASQSDGPAPVDDQLPSSTPKSQQLAFEALLVMSPPARPDAAFEASETTASPTASPSTALLGEKRKRSAPSPRQPPGKRGAALAAVPVDADGADSSDDEVSLPDPDTIRPPRVSSSAVQHATSSLHALLADLALVASSPSEGTRQAEKSDVVTLSTVHSAKGLEWPAVFLFGTSANMFPHAMSQDHDEETRLLYVAATRAQILLSVSWFRHRRSWGRDEETGVSPFIASLAASLIPAGGQRKGRAQPRDPRLASTLLLPLSPALRAQLSEATEAFGLEPDATPSSLQSATPTDAEAAAPARNAFGEATGKTRQPYHGPRRRKF